MIFTTDSFWRQQMKYEGMFYQIAFAFKKDVAWLVTSTLPKILWRDDCTKF